MIDDHDLERGLGRMEFQPKLLAQSLEKCRPLEVDWRVRIAWWRPIRLRCPFDREVEQAAERGLIHHRAI
jgi:hypothetical protein